MQSPPLLPHLILPFNIKFPSVSIWSDSDFSTAFFLFTEYLSISRLSWSQFPILQMVWHLNQWQWYVFFCFVHAYRRFNCLSTHNRTNNEKPPSLQIVQLNFQLFWVTAEKPKNKFSYFYDRLVSHPFFFSFF